MTGGISAGHYIQCKWHGLRLKTRLHQDNMMPVNKVVGNMRPVAVNLLFVYIGNKIVASLLPVSGAYLEGGRTATPLNSAKA